MRNDKKRGGTGQKGIPTTTFVAISAVEGLTFTKASRQRLRSMESRKLSAAEKRAEVVQAYMKTKSR